MAGPLFTHYHYHALDTPFLPGYQQFSHEWRYSGGGAVLVLVAMIQLLQVDTVTDSTLPTCVLWSAAAMYTLYGCALANSRAAVLVDVQGGASPTLQLQE